MQKGSIAKGQRVAIVDDIVRFKKIFLKPFWNSQMKQFLFWFKNINVILIQLSTGGSMRATAECVEQLSAKPVLFLAVSELPFLGGAKQIHSRFPDAKIVSLYQQTRDQQQL